MQNLIGMTAILMTLLISVPSPLVSGGENQFKELLDRNGVEENFNSHDFQSAIRSGNRLGALAQENSTIGDPAKSYGFAAKSEEAKFFIIGALYSEALAYLHGRKMNLAAKRLESIETEFINLGVPSSLYNLISKTRNVVETERYPAELTGEVLSLFQPFFEDYAKGKGGDFLVLFRSGSWLVDMGLAAAAGDKNIIRQDGKLRYFIDEMKRMDAPKGVLNALDEIKEIAGKEEITDKDLTRVQTLVNKVQTILS